MSSEYDAKLVKALATLTGASPGSDWADWMRWQEAHPGVIPGFAKLQARVYDLIDPNFQVFRKRCAGHTLTTGDAGLA